LTEIAGPAGESAEIAVAAARAATDAAWEARRLGVSGSERSLDALAEAILAVTRRALAAPDVEEWPAIADDLLALRRPLRTGIDLDRAQELVVDALAAAPDDDLIAALAASLGVAQP
jgi:hypothetical protein